MERLKIQVYFNNIENIDYMTLSKQRNKNKKISKEII